MPRNTSFALGDHFVDFVDGQVKSGRYASASEVVRAGLRLLEEHDDRAKALREALAAGESSGTPQPLDFDGLKSAKRSGFSRQGA